VQGSRFTITVFNHVAWSGYSGQIQNVPGGRCKLGPKHPNTNTWSMDSRGFHFQRVFRFIANPLCVWGLFTLCLIPLVLSKAELSSMKLWDDVLEKHSWPSVPKGWVLHGPVPQSHTLELHIALREGNPDALVSNLLEVSDPTHKRYFTILTP
jgi:hypothetical protein